MTGLLVSVRSSDEAELAIAAGADLIDVKEPRAGPLAAAPPPTVTAIMRCVARRRPTSIALGELLDGARWSDYGEHLSAEEFPRFVKYGLAGCASVSDLRQQWQAALDELPSTITPVAVAYADWQAADAPEPKVVLSLARQLRCGALLVDTFDKRGPGLLGLWPTRQLADCVARAREAQLLVVLGGQISIEQIDRLLPLEPDLIAVRGAVCDVDRSGRLDRRRVEQLCHRIRRCGMPDGLARRIEFV